MSSNHPSNQADACRFIVCFATGAASIRSPLCQEATSAIRAALISPTSCSTNVAAARTRSSASCNASFAMEMAFLSPFGDNCPKPMTAAARSNPGSCLKHWLIAFNITSSPLAATHASASIAARLTSADQCSNFAETNSTTRESPRGAMSDKASATERLTPSSRSSKSAPTAAIAFSSPSGASCAIAITECCLTETERSSKCAKIAVSAALSPLCETCVMLSTAARRTSQSSSSSLETSASQARCDSRTSSRKT
mmetsp:Transcript_77382/g.122185  ORF Transcript_77382/g.122185 Transcript_77382/m.122185 type:complete len:254 (-) Transcript_77382:100-861(-)